MPPALQRRAEEVHDCWSLASRHPQVADAGLRRGDWERRAIVPAAWQKIVKQVGKIFDGVPCSLQTDPKVAENTGEVGLLQQRGNRSWPDFRDRTIVEGDVGSPFNRDGWIIPSG